jgi:GT2 family glycosyltransferase
MSNDTFFAAFIMTYNRVSILEDTIKKIFSQSLPPHKVIIIDNDYNFSAKEIQNNYPEYNISYHPIGYNSGPAGAAKVGLEILVNEGYQWIAWMDDDDPPIFENTFEILLNMATSNVNCGCVGVVGHFFNRRTGFMKRVPDYMLQTNGILEVDTIAGGMYKIVSGKMIRECNVKPDKKLFFGFEELDFDIQIKKANYKLLVDRAFYWKHRVHFNRVILPKKALNLKSDAALVREYFSIRNIFYLTAKNKLYTAFIYIFCYHFFKQLLRLKKNIRSGLKGFKIFFLAFFHFLTGKMGYRKVEI